MGRQQLRSDQKVRGDQMTSIPFLCHQMDFTQGDVIWFITRGSSSCDQNLARLITRVHLPTSTDHLKNCDQNLDYLLLT